MIVCHFVYFIPAIAFFTWIFEIFLIVGLIEQYALHIMQNCNLVHVCMYMKPCVFSIVFLCLNWKIAWSTYILCEYVNDMSEEIK